MKGERLKHTINLWLRLTAAKRMRYLKDHHVFGAVGENSSYMGRVVPLYANLIRIGSNVHIASGVSLVCHDTVHIMLNRSKRYQGRFSEKIGCIEIGDNVFIGTGATILYNVRIGSNVVIGAGSLVNRDIPDNSVAAGIPARVVKSFDDFARDRLNEEKFPDGEKPQKESVSRELAEWCWERFYEQRK